MNLNGKIVPADGNYFSSTNRALRYGDGLFEGLRILNGEFLFFEDHINRLLGGMKALQLSVPENFSSNYFFKLISDLVRANKISCDVMVRIQVYRSGGGLYEPATDESEFFIELLNAPADGFMWNENKIVVGIFSDWRKELNPAMSFKTSNSLVYVMAAKWKKENKLDDAIILNAQGNICDATSSNVFIWKSGKLFTPQLSEGAVRGVTRKNLMEFCSTQNISLTEKIISADELVNADEIFLTNISRGIRSVGRVVGQETNHGYDNSLTKKLATDFYNFLKKKE